MKLLLTVLFILFLALQGNSQRMPDPVFHKLEVEMLGVSSALYQVWDSRGRLWLVTDKGLLCHNGYQTVIHPAEKNTENAPLSDQIRSLLKVADDEFWITYKKRTDVSKFNPVTNEYAHFYTDTNNVNGYPDAELTRIIYENDSVRWLLTWGKGICRLNIKTGCVTGFANNDSQISEGEPPVNMVKDMVKLEEDKYLVGFFFESDFATPYYFKPSTGKFTPVDLDPFLKKHDQRMGYLIRKALTMVNFIYMDPNGNHWIGTYVGLIYLNWKDQTARRISGKENDLYRQNLENTRSFIIDQRGLIWTGTPNQGILLVDPETAETKYIRHNVTSESSLSDDRLTSIATDPTGNIWIATESGTFSICNPLTQNFKIHPWSDMDLDFSNRSLQQIPVNQILVMPDGKILISNATGLVEYDINTQIARTILKPLIIATAKSQNDMGIQHFRKIGNELFFITAINQRPDIATRYNLETKKITPVNVEKNINKMLFRHSDQNAPLVFYSHWISTELFVYNKVSNGLDSLATLPDTLRITENFTLMLNSGKWMFPFEQGRFGILDPQSNGLSVYHTKSTTHFFPDSTINCAYKDMSGIVWIGTQTAIYRFDENENKIERYNHKTGLHENEKVNAITQDKNGYFWIFLAKEMVRWDSETGDFFRFKKSHGLNPGTFLPAVAQQDSLDNIYIACYNGILVFDPDKIQLPADTLQLYLASAKLRESPLDTKKMLAGQQLFTSDENYFTFEFHTNEVFTLTPNQFFFRLHGRDHDWQDNGISNRIRFADLGPGEYILEVKTVNTFGTESNTLQIPFIIAKPFWQTWWFITAVLILTGCLVWIYIRFREKTLRRKSLELERIVGERTADVVKEKKEADKQRLEAEHQKEIVEEKQKEISDSINYAKRIQNAILPSNRFFKTNLPESFILYLPKDIVAGDFYFMENTADFLILGVADCTGHGVPGAMVSVVCHNALTRSVKEFGLTLPHEILDKTRELVLETFAKSEDQVNDGMDIALCSIDRKNKILYFSGANNGLFLIRNNEIVEFKPDKQPIGKFIHAKPFGVTKIQFEKDDQFYLFSDGYADQFGGEAGKPGGKKFKYSRLKTLLQEIHLKDADNQHRILLQTLIQWRGEIEQVDDVCIIGFKIS